MVRKTSLGSDPSGICGSNVIPSTTWTALEGAELTPCSSEPRRWDLIFEDVPCLAVGPEVAEPWMGIVPASAGSSVVNSNQGRGRCGQKLRQVDQEKQQ